jgi:hypothetical protein
VRSRAASLLEHEDKTVAKMAFGEARNSIRLTKLLRGIEPKGFVAHGDVEIASVAYDSRKISPGALFVAIRGEKTDGNKFVADAADRGAVAVASEQPRPDAFPAHVVWVEVPDARKALAIIAANYFGRPAEVLKLVGVTGTNGKTTTAYLWTPSFEPRAARLGCSARSLTVWSEIRSQPNARHPNRSICREFWRKWSASAARMRS